MNVAEGWHNGLNRRFGMSHPTLRLFLDWLQKYQFEVQCRRMQLEAGKPPKPKSPVYAKLDADLWQANMSFSVQYGRIFCDVFPYNASVGLWQFRVAAEHYLARVSYLLGCN